MDWERYAKHYDLMCSLNPAYLDNLALLRECLERYPLSYDARVCDLGAGTGNYIKAISEIRAGFRFLYVDPSEEMLKVARHKLAEMGEGRIQFQLAPAEECLFQPASFDLILCINALYAMDDPRLTLRRIREWLSPDGYAFILDFGRVQNTLDWAKYLLFESIKSGNLGKYLWSLLVGREVLRQNRLTRVGQQSGRYWLHSTEEFSAIIEQAGLNIKEVGVCYRGYCDYAIVKRCDPGDRPKSG